MPLDSKINKITPINSNNPTESEKEFLEDYSEEELIADLLEAEQESYAAINSGIELYNQGLSFKHPSYFKYGILFILAAIVDIIDFADLSGIGLFIARIVSFAASALIILVLWLTNTKQKSADEYVENAQKKIEFITQKISEAERKILTVAKISRKIPGVKKLYRKAHMATIRRLRLGLRKLTKNTKNPIIRSLASGTLNLVPFLSIVPWMIIGIWLSYRAEKESYKKAEEMANTILENLGENVS
jgi:hypothetical protein